MQTLTLPCRCPSFWWAPTQTQQRKNTMHLSITPNRAGYTKYLRPCRAHPHARPYYCHYSVSVETTIDRLQTCSVLFFWWWLRALVVTVGFVAATRSQVAKRSGGVRDRRRGEGEGSGLPLCRPGAARRRQQPENNSRDLPASHRHGVSRDGGRRTSRRHRRFVRLAGFFCFFRRRCYPHG